MSWRSRWVVLVPGEVAWVKRRTREILEENYEGIEVRYTIVPGQDGYQAIVQEGPRTHEPEVILGSELSLECEKPVYAIEGYDEFPYILRFVRGEDEWEDREAEDLVRELGCVMPWGEDPPLKPLKRVTRTVVLIQGLSKARVLAALEKQAEFPLREGHYCLEDVPQGLILRGGTGELVIEDIELAQRFPRATVYSVVATPSLDFFVVNVARNRRTEKFACPPWDSRLLPVIHEVMGEHTPERILAALGMSKEWFRLQEEEGKTS